tara:strand:+ start:275 stop:928 length:654 start_codon:yes stop_codon:yes gene_type:complete
MKKVLYSIGDSWTFGYDLENPSKECYPYLLSKKLKCELVNEALPGGSNDWMFRKSIEWISKNDLSEVKLFIVGWSFVTRREENFTFYHGGDPKYERINFKNDKISNLISDNLYNNKLSTIKTFTYIYALQEILSKKQVDYLFYFPLDEILIQDEWYETNVKSEVHDIYLNIDKSRCIGPKLNNEVIITGLEQRHPNKKESEWISEQLYNFLRKNHGF